MTNEPRLERFLAGVARLASGSRLHPLAVLQAVENAAGESISDGSLANAYLVELHPSDAGAFGRELPDFTRAVTDMLDSFRDSRKLVTLGPWDIDLAASSAVAQGSVLVTPSFRNPTVGVGAARAAANTQVLTRQRNKFLVVDGVGRVRLTVTPFVIGRTSDCNLMLLDRSVSRRHAVIEQASNGQLFIRDLGSRNKLVVDGETLDEAILVPGVPVLLGSTRIVLEVEA